MLKKPLVITALIILAIALYYFYESQLPVAGVVSMGEKEEMTAWVSLAGSIIALVAAIIGLVQAILQGRRKD